jgi:hypothetical protein
MRFTRALAWAWMIIIGGLLITPGGVFCIACGRNSAGYIGDTAVLILGLVSLVLGAVGIVGAIRERSGAAGQAVRT